MVGISLICHGKMAEGMKDSVGLIIGEQKQFNVLGLFEGNDFDKFTNDAYETIAGSDDGHGVLVFVDLLGASPYNAASMNVTKLRENNINIRVITGVNLPMLIEAFMQREIAESLDELYPAILSSGKNSITELFEELGK